MQYKERIAVIILLTNKTLGAMPKFAKQEGH